MAVDQKEPDLADEKLEFQKMYAVMESWNKFCRNNQESAFYSRYKTRKTKMLSRVLWSPSSQLCRRQPFPREYLFPCLNCSEIINPEIGEGPVDEVGTLWSRW